jgi:hypothetical protein
VETYFFLPSDATVQEDVKPAISSHFDIPRQDQRLYDWETEEPVFCGPLLAQDRSIKNNQACWTLQRVRHVARLSAKLRSFNEKEAVFVIMSATVRMVIIEVAVEIC